MKMEKWLWLDLETKIAKTKALIVEYTTRHDAYLSFSGGKDSTVLLDIITKMGINMPIVFIDTGLEYPEIRKFALERATKVVKPDLTFVDVLKKYGIPVASKEQSSFVEEILVSGNKQSHNRLDGFGRFKLSRKWRPLLDAPFKVSSKCCYHMKKKPATKYEKESGRSAILGTRASESKLRMQQWLTHGCYHQGERTKLSPLSFWSSEDVDRYIVGNGVEICEIYEHYDRTGCAFCLMGRERNDWEGLKKLVSTHPTIWEYLKREFGYDEVVYYMETRCSCGRSGLVDYLYEDEDLGEFQYVATRRKDGYKEGFSVQSDFAKKYGLIQNKISDCLNGKAKSHKGWTFAKLRESTPC